MNTKRIIAMLIAAIMVLSLVPVMAISTSAANEGMWTTYQGAGAYPSADDADEDPEDLAYPPEAGYEYTSDGFSVIQPDWTDITPFVTVSSKETVNLKDGLYLEFRVDAYSYGGANGADHWIALTLNTGKTEEDGSVTGKVQPGSTMYGGGWLTLLRGNGNGSISTFPHITEPTTEEVGGKFLNIGMSSNQATLDDEGREIHTFEVTYDEATGYQIKVNGVVEPDNFGTLTRTLDSQNADGEFYVGIVMMDTVATNGAAELTITKFGTSAEDAVKPTGTDSKEPQENTVRKAPIADSSTIEAGQPAMLWTPETYNLKAGNNVNFAVLGDNTWRGTATESAVFFNMNPKRSWSYEAADFPVFGIMFRNLWVDSGVLYYAAGEFTSASDANQLPISVFDGEFYNVGDDEYIFIPVSMLDLEDMTPLWEGRINGIRVDLALQDETVREFDICFAGMFRTAEEGFAYAEKWLEDNNLNVDTETETEDDGDETTVADDETTAAPETTVADETTGENTTGEKGCASVIGVSAVAILAAAAAAVALKKKD